MTTTAAIVATRQTARPTAPPHSSSVTMDTASTLTTSVTAIMTVVTEAMNRTVMMDHLIVMMVMMVMMRKKKTICNANKELSFTVVTNASTSIIDVMGTMIVAMLETRPTVLQLAVHLGFTATTESVLVGVTAVTGITTVAMRVTRRAAAEPSGPATTQPPGG